MKPHHGRLMVPNSPRNVSFNLVTRIIQGFVVQKLRIHRCHKQINIWFVFAAVVSGKNVEILTVR